MPTALGTVASHRSVTSTGPIPTTGLALWLDADDASTFSYSSSVIVSEWRDKSGGNHHAAQSGQSKPTRDGVINGRPALNIQAPAPLALLIPAFASTYTAAELFMVLDVTVENDGGYLGWWGTATSLSHYPTGGVVYEGWGTDTRKTIGNPVPELTTPHTYNVRTAANSYAAAFNGVDLFTTSSNTVAFRNTPYQIGQQDFPGNGYMGELIMYNRVLSTVERQQVEQYLAAKWLPPPPIPTTGLVGWWDADDTASFTFGGGGNLVSQWNDKSGANNHATWVNSSWPATRVAAGISGKAAVDFHPSALNTPLSSNLKPGTVICALKTGAVTGGTNLTGFAYTAPTNIGCFSWDVSNGVVRLMKSNVALIGQATSAYTANTPAVLGVTYGTGNVWTHYRDGAPVGTGTTVDTFVDSILAIGGGGVAYPPGAWDGLFGELVIYNRVLSTVERQQVESYLKTKWGTP